MNADLAEEPISPEFRTEVISKACRDVASGSLRFSLKLTIFSPEDQKLILAVWSRLGQSMVAYVSPEIPHEARQKIEPQMFADIVALKTNGVLIEDTNRSELESHIQKLDERFDALTELMRDVLEVLRQILRGLPDE